ncbi:MAG: DoxX family protein [Halioglobus sp.]
MFSWKTLGLAIVFAWFMGGGITHFTNPDFFVSIMPPWIGWHLEIVYISGVFEILGALGILVPSLRLWAGNGLLLLVVCVTPANVHMWMQPELFPDVPEVMLSVRLVVQVILLWVIWASTRPKDINEVSQGPAPLSADGP